MSNKSGRDLFELDLCGALRLVRSGAVSLQELFQHHLDKISALNGRANALRFVDAARAAKAIEQRQKELAAGANPGRLHGMLYSAKDSVHVAGMPRSDGSANGGSVISTSDSALAAKLSAEGAICIGKGNMAEYGKSYFTENPLFGRTNNPFLSDRSPGGSGGGDACAVALDFAQFGLGADAGGSIRIPANFCGLFGLYPTRGLLSDAGGSSFAHTTVHLFRNAGPLTKSLDDLDLVFKVLRGFDNRDQHSTETPLSFRTSSRPQNASFAYFTALNGVNCDEEVKAEMEKTVQALEQAGYRPVEYAPPACELAYEIFIVLAGQAALMLEDQLALEAGTPRNLSLEGPAVKTLRQRIATELPELTVPNLLKAWYRVDALRSMITRDFDKYSFLVAPVCAGLPPLHGTSIYEVGGQKLQSQQHFQFASMVNLLGLPSIAFPTGVSRNGLALGLQVIGPRFSESMLIAVLRSIGITNRPSELVQRLKNTPLA
ncbi:MAG: amidase [Deltaproteobacteria bacterium]|nr:amidase [Deltaproteobacteria bacterium]